MSLGPHIAFIKDNASQQLKKFTEDARLSSTDSQWRCLYSALDPQITKDAQRKTIVAEFFKSFFAKAHETKAFWLHSGHLFIFFQGPVRAIIKDYEAFLNALGATDEKSEYNFFWELDKFKGYFDEVLTLAIEGVHENPDSKQENEDTANDDVEHYNDDYSELHRQRQVRYKPLLLIVEDDRITRHLLQATMEKYCDIVVAWDAAQARKIYKAMLPNMAFLDIELPDGDGQDLVELFCQNDPDSFIVMISGSLSTAKIERCVKAGARDFVAKPAQENKLLKFVDQYHKERQKKVALA